MYEQLTYEQIKARMLGVVHELETAEGLVFDKREGSIVDVALSPFALESKNMFIAIDWLLRQVFADTADRKYLIMRAAERGVSPREASFAVRVAYVTFSDSPTAQTAAGYLTGARFNRGTLNYAFKEVKSIEDGVAVCTVTCETAGSVGNVDFGDLTPLSSIQNFTSAELIAAEDLTDDEEEYVIPGEDEESTEDFRKRYFRSFDVAFGGNVADYRNHIDDIDGVGGVRIRRAWENGGYVEAYVQNVIAEGGGAASADTVALVQETIDPFGVASPVIVDGVEWGQGTGLGLAPIGHRVRIYSVTEAPIHITGAIELKTGYENKWVDVKKAIKDNLETYYAPFRENWEGDAIYYEDNDSNTTEIIWARVLSVILNTEGVKTVSDLFITTPTDEDETRDVGSDLKLIQSEVPVLGRLNEFVISGTVTDAGGDPVEGVTVTTSTAGEPVTTGADGTYSILVDGGSQTISASKVGYLPYTDTVEITEDTVIDITLAQGVVVRGIVTDGTNALQGVAVAIGGNTTTTNEDGGYQVTVVSSETAYTVTYTKDGYETETRSVTATADVTVETVVMTATSGDVIVETFDSAASLQTDFCLWIGNLQTNAFENGAYKVYRDPYYASPDAYVQYLAWDVKNTWTLTTNGTITVTLTDRAAADILSMGIVLVVQWGASSGLLKMYYYDFSEFLPSDYQGDTVTVQLNNPQFKLMSGASQWEPVSGTVETREYEQVRIVCGGFDAHSAEIQGAALGRDDVYGISEMRVVG